MNPILVTILAVAVAALVGRLAVDATVTSLAATGAGAPAPPPGPPPACGPPSATSSAAWPSSCPARSAAFVAERLDLDTVSSRTAWPWMERFGAPALALALASGHRHPGLIRLLDAPAPPDLQELGILAAARRTRPVHGPAGAVDARADL